MAAKPPALGTSLNVTRADPAIAAQFRAGKAAQQRGDLAAAESAYRAVITAEPRHADALHLLAIIEAQRGRPAQAEELFARALELHPDDHNIHNNRANVLCALRRYDEAARSFERAIALNPAYPDPHANFGKALHEQGRFEQALARFDQAIALKPDFVEALFQRGLALLALQRNQEALLAFERVLEVRPGYGDAHFNRGNLLRTMERNEDALISFERAIAANPEQAEAWCNRANTLVAMGHAADGLSSVERALTLNPGFALAYGVRGEALAALERLPEALASVDRAIVLQPALADSHNNRGIVLQRMGRGAEAITSFDRAIALRPGFAAAHANRAVALLDLRRPHDALAAADRAIEFDPRQANSHNIRGSVLQEMNRHAEALQAYLRARELQPGFAEAEWNESVCRLLYGDFERGWPLFESRWRNGQQLGELKLQQPLWDGRKVDGTLLAWGEQGIGDQIHQLGMVDGLAAHAREVVVAVNERLVSLVARSLPAMRVIGLNAALRENCAMQTPLGSLGRHLRRSWDDFPLGRAAYLQADPVRVARLKKSVQGAGRLTCGVSWHSVAPKVGAAKSIALRELAPLLRLPDLQFVDLQYGDTAAERSAVADELGVELVHVDAVDNRGDLEGLAALISACDVVVTISNTTAHLAGALGVPTLLMLPFGAARHWYWHEGRDDSPWYPSMHLYRQRVRGDWSAVFAEVAAAVQHLATSRRA